MNVAFDFHRGDEARAPRLEVAGTATGLHRRRTGFTLIELLVVMAIMSILLAATVSAINTILTSNAITTNSDQVVSMINLARQDALSLNSNVYVVFFQYVKKTPWDTGNGRFRAVQLYQDQNTPAQDQGGGATATDTFVPLTKPVILTGTTVMDDSPASSTLFETGPGGSNATTSLTNFTPPTQFGSPISYVAFCCRPDGGTSLANLTSNGTNNQNIPVGFPTILICDLKTLKTTGLPSNYSLIQINPVNGIARSFRP
jgi:uncharacterized protein (TIGR02596 family)